MRKFSRLFILLLAIPLSSFATDRNTREKLAKDFVKIMRYNEQYQQYHKQCLNNQKTVTPDTIVKSNPNYFNGIKPGNRLWNSVVDIYNQYYEEVCSRPTEQEFLSAMAESYAQKLDISDLEQAIKFYTSPIGEKLISAHKQAASSVYEKIDKINIENIPRAMANYQKKINNLCGRPPARKNIF